MSARKPNSTTDLDQRRYDDTLRKLSEASVDRKFEAFKDIDWDNPDYAVSDDDERWILGEVDPLGAHPWYKAQPKAKQIAMGKYRYASIMKVGSIFEQVLIGGLTTRAIHLPNGSPDYRYTAHEMIEEFNHTLMFQETVNRLGVDVEGRTAGTWRRILLETAPLIMMMGRLWPELFLVGILGGEEPIDYAQKQILRSGNTLHPMVKRVMQIHVAEEARHISYAHLFLKHRVPKQNVAKRWALSVLFPMIMRGMNEAILVPTPTFFERFEVPDSVRKQIWWDSPQQKQALAETFNDVRALAEEIGLINPVSQRVWKLLGIDSGDASRYRSEPARKPSNATSPAA